MAPIWGAILGLYIGKITSFKRLPSSPFMSVGEPVGHILLDILIEQEPFALEQTLRDGGVLQEDIERMASCAEHLVRMKEMRALQPPNMVDMGIAFSCEQERLLEHACRVAGLYPDEHITLLPNLSNDSSWNLGILIPRFQDVKDYSIQGHKG